MALSHTVPAVDARLRELDFGSWNDRTHNQCAASDGDRFLRWIGDPACETPPGGESFIEFTARVDAAIDSLPPEGTALVVAHGGPIRRIIARAIGLEWKQVVLMQISPCGITRLALHQDGGHLLCLNDTAHLETRGGSTE